MIDRRDANECVAEGFTLAEVAALFGLRRQTVWRLEQAAIRKLWRRPPRRVAAHPPTGIDRAQPKGDA